MFVSLTKKEAQNRIDSKYGEGSYKIESEYVNNSTKIKVRHFKCGKVIETTLSHLVTSGRRCSYCYNGNAKTPEEFSKEFKGKFKGKFKQLTDYHRVHEKIQVLSVDCGHKFWVEPNTFMRGAGKCSMCLKNRKITHEEFMAVFNKLANGEYLLKSTYINNTSTINVKHLECGNEYKVTPKDFKSGNRCPICRSSKGEKLIASILDSNNISYVREKSFKGLQSAKKPNTIKSHLRYDFYLPDYNTLIEYDGIQHFKKVPYFDKGGESLKSRKARDAIKNKYAEDNGYNLLRIPYTLSDDKAKETILNNL